MAIQPMDEIMAFEEKYLRMKKALETLVEAATYATCGGTCQHNRCQGLQDAVAEAKVETW